MSAAVKAALLASHDLPKTERLVLVAVAAHANHDGDAWPSVATVAGYVGCSTRTVQRALAKLVQLGRLVVRKVASLATRVYRLVTGATDPAVRGDTQAPAATSSVSPEVEDQEKKEARAPRDWRRFLPKSRQNPPERRGAALPPPVGADRCPRHIGHLAHNCGSCRSERLAGGVR